MTNHRELRKRLWQNPEQCSLTAHEKGVAEQLESTANLEIRGEIGSGKTFTVRHYLREHDILYKYLTAAELLEAEVKSYSNDTIQAAQTIVIDNFDAIPAERDALEYIFKHIEMQFQGAGRGVWLLLPKNFHNTWFESVLAGFQTMHLKKDEITKIHAAHVQQNIESMPENDSITIDIDPEQLEQWGYHAVVTGMR
jgi:hypothetical protein